MLLADFATAQEDGRATFASIRKVPSQASTASWWVDLSMAAGNPPPNYYAAAPLEAKTLDAFDGIFHGGSVAPLTKHLASWHLVTPTAAAVGRYTLCDYLLYYPFVDGDAAGEVQAMDNTTATLNRYAEAGGQVMAVAVAPSTGGGSFTFDYINQSGVLRTSPVQKCSTTAANIATLVTSQPAVAGLNAGPFLALAEGDSGVRSIESCTFTVANGGLVALVIVSPLADLAIREINTANEVESVRTDPTMPRIFDGAYLGMIHQPAGSVPAATIAGNIYTVWSST